MFSGKKLARLYKINDAVLEPFSSFSLLVGMCKVYLVRECVCLCLLQQLALSAEAIW